MKCTNLSWKNPRARFAGLWAVGACVALAPLARGAQLGTVFVIAMENHNWTQPSGQSSPQPVKNNPAAPFITSLITPGNANAAQTAYENNYYHPGLSEHPSEPNYVWAEAGTNFNPIATGTATATNQGLIVGQRIASDSDPSVSAKNILTNVPHLTGQLNAKGIPWKNYEEDYQYSSSPLVSASGTGGVHNGNTVVANPYNGSTQYDYAAKHNPMAFFNDTATQNVATLGSLQTDLNNNTVGKYNWITPNQFNDMHTSLSGGFTDPRNSTHFTGDSANIAQGDNFLSMIVPAIMASQAYQNNGAIIIWNDETEGGDDASRTSMEIAISPLAKGNAYSSNVVTSHSSDINTMQELFGLLPFDNAIPSSETFAGGGYATVIGSNDLSDLFVANAIPEPASLGLLGLGGLMLFGRKRAKG